jgi:hypothetical protein
MQSKYFAQIENNIVTQVIVARQDFVDALGGTWVETTVDGSLRKNYAGIGYAYDPTFDAFIPPKPECHSEVVLDEATCLWICTNEDHTIKEIN